MGDPTLHFTLKYTEIAIMGITSEVPKTVQWNGSEVPVYSMQTIDFSRLLSQEPEELEKLLKCCQDEGFFYIDLQGIDGRRFLDDQQETLKLMNKFFDSPLEVKNEFGLVAPHLGYEPVGSRTGVLENTKDGYEMVKVSRDEIQSESPHIPRNIKNSHRNHRASSSTLAMMHYVPSDPVKDKNIGHQKHTDISSLTLLFSEQWGLQIRPPGKTLPREEDS